MEESLKLGLIEQYVENQHILHILPHAWFKYIVLSLKYSFVLLCLGLIYQFIGIDISLFFMVLGIILYAKFIYDFVDIYLDSVVLTDKGVTMVTIDKRFTYKTDFFEWKSIVSISGSQHGFIDKIFNQGSIMLSLDHDSDYLIKNISGPNSQVSILNKYKFDSLSRLKHTEELNKQELASQPDKFEILVDTLSEVIGSYMKNGNNSH